MKTNKRIPSNQTKKNVTNMKEMQKINELHEHRNQHNKHINKLSDEIHAKEIVSKKHFPERFWPKPQENKRGPKI